MTQQGGSSFASKVTATGKSSVVQGNSTRIVNKYALRPSTYNPALPFTSLLIKYVY